MVTLEDNRIDERNVAYGTHEVRIIVRDIFKGSEVYPRSSRAIVALGCCAVRVGG